MCHEVVYWGSWGVMRVRTCCGYGLGGWWWCYKEMMGDMRLYSGNIRGMGGVVDRSKDKRNLTNQVCRHIVMIFIF